MQVPAVMFIEEALETLKSEDVTQGGIPPETKEAILHELTMLGDERLYDIGSTGLSGDTKAGYLLGIQVMRVLIMQMPQAAGIAI